MTGDASSGDAVPSRSDVPDGALPAGVVFDLDGTIVDTETISDNVLATVLAEFGHEVSDEDLLATRGRAWSWLEPWLRDRWGVDGDSYRERSRPAWRAQLRDGVPTFPDAMAVLDALWGRGVPLALCTSSGRSHCDRMLELVGIEDRFVATVTASDVERHKPDRAPYALAHRLLGTPAAGTVAIEDTRIGATAARAAGLRVVGRPHPGTADLADLVHRQVDELTLGDLVAALHDPVPSAAG